ncbi:hypothetical protein OA58_08310 [Microcystis aeruginosa NIES-88]|nr:hypothetical protein OA58_08310 [Microcystis aeruginosa NIES-88]BCU11021.1 hypothetical protein MAN88_15850 [Microcystis aeruginosa]
MTSGTCSISKSKAWAICSTLNPKTDKRGIEFNLAVNAPSSKIGAAEKVFRGGRVWGVGCGVWGFTHFQVVNYLIFREKIPKFSPQSLQW